MRQKFLFLVFILFSSFELFACSCSRRWNDSFSLTARNSEFVALVKIISFDEYLDRKITDYDRKIPYSMTVEIIKKYKGKENRKRITIFGDNGIMCRPYLSNFELNGYYLISPNPLNNSETTEYDFFVCRTEYLKVDIESNKPCGNYSMFRNKIDLTSFESKLKNGNGDVVIIIVFGILLILVPIIVRRNIKEKVTIKTTDFYT
ncbi:hypothetical protein [Kordia jejudonensis]|uniref:hypothetical protein n=1 Tax=Kordia jejudonensis TaxID=1348245 RepID=UPI0007ED0937|nr:hypothetical protein [Kordia jejudonensis]